MSSAAMLGSVVGSVLGQLFCLFVLFKVLRWAYKKGPAFFSLIVFLIFIFPLIVFSALL